MVEAQEPAEALPAYDRSRPVEVGGRQDELAAQDLMVRNPGDYAKAS